MSDRKENWWDIGSGKVKVLDATLWFSHKMFFGVFFFFFLEMWILLAYAFCRNQWSGKDEEETWYDGICSCCW